MQETMMAILIVTAATAGTAKLLHLVAQQQRSEEYRELAVLEAANVMEDVMARNGSDFAADTATYKLSEVCRNRLPDARLQVQSDPETGDAGVRRVTVIIDWRAPTGHRNRPVRLVAWRSKDLSEAMP